MPTALDSASVLLPSNAPFLPRFPVRPPCRRFHASAWLPPNGALPKLSHRFPSVHPVVASVYCSLPTELFPNSFPRLPVRPPWPRFRVAPSQPSSLPKLFPTVSVRPPCRRFRVAPSQRSFPQAISHFSPSVHPVVTSVSLPPNGALPKSYFAHLQFPVRPPCRRLRFVAPSHGSFPRAISHGFLSVHHVHASVSLPPTGALPKLFPTVSRLSTLSSLKCRSPRGKVN